MLYSVGTSSFATFWTTIIFTCINYRKWKTNQIYKKYPFKFEYASKVHYSRIKHFVDNINDIISDNMNINSSCINRKKYTSEIVFENDDRVLFDTVASHLHFTFYSNNSIDEYLCNLIVA